MLPELVRCHRKISPLSSAPTELVLAVTTEQKEVHYQLVRAQTTLSALNIPLASVNVRMFTDTHVGIRITVDILLRDFSHREATVAALHNQVAVAEVRLKCHCQLE